MKRIFALLSFSLIHAIGFAQPTANTRYWIGGNGSSGVGAIDFTAATSWATTAGGTSGASFNNNQTNYIFNAAGTYYVKVTSIFSEPGFITLGNNVTVYFQYQPNTGVAAIQAMLGVNIPNGSKLVIENLNSGTGVYTFDYSRMVTTYPSTINGELEIAATNKGVTYGGGASMPIHMVSSTGVIRLTGTTNGAPQFNSSTLVLVMQAGSNMYINSNNGNSVGFAGSFDAASTIHIAGNNHTNGTASKLPASSNYGNIIVDLPNNNSNLPIFGSGGYTIKGNLIVKNTGISTARVGFTLNSGTPGTINGNFVLDNSVGTTAPKFQCILNSESNTDATTNIDGNIEVQAGATLDLGIGGVGVGKAIGLLNVKRNFINNGTITETGGNTSTTGYPITLNGTTTQTISGIGTYSNDVSLVFNNAAGFVLNNNITLSNGSNATISFENGKVNGNGNTIIVQNGLSSAVRPLDGTIANDGDSYVYNGTIRRNMQTASTIYLFPVGSLQFYYPARIVPTSTNSNFSVRFYPQWPIGNNWPLNGDAAVDGTGFIAPYYWDIQSTAGQSANGIGLGYTTTTAGVLDPSRTKVVHLDAAIPATPFWETLGGSALFGPINCAPNPSCGYISSAAISSANPWTDFSPFTLAGNVGVLPIDINSFTAQKISSNTNSINWRAACNVLNKATFEVQRSTNGTNFTTIYTETATQARCASPFNYADNYNATSAITYYRLRVTGIVGEAKYSTIAVVNNKGSKLALVTIYPTLVNNSATVLVQSTQNNTTGVFVITNAQGAVVNKFTKVLNEGGNVFTLETNYLAAGTYQLTAYVNGEMVTTRFIK
jgi:hypothetical protein